MKVRRATHEDLKHFPAEVIHKRLGYVVDNNEKTYVYFTIFDMFNAKISTIDERWLDDAIKAFRFHNGFVYRFYDKNGVKVREYDKVELLRVDPLALGVTQWLVSEKKLSELNQWVGSPEDIVIPVFEYQKRLIALDGHTRLKAAHYWEMPYVYVYKETGDGLSKAFYNSAIKRDVKTIEDVEVVDSSRYKNEWDFMCDGFIKTYNSKKALRSDAFKLRNTINEDEHHQLNERLIEKLSGFLRTHRLQRIGVFYPMGNEVDLRVFDVSYETYYPIIEEDKLVFAPNVGTFVKAPFKTHVPATKERLNGTLDAVIVPGLFFDLEGFRLGYGKGYYDGFLKHYTGLSIGVCFDRFVKPAIPKESHDQCVKYVVTERQVIEVKSCTQR